MIKYDLKLPTMGEGVSEATVTSWVKNVGDVIEEGEIIVSVATDKVDNEIPSEVSGVLTKQCFDIDDVVQVGQSLAIIEVETPSLQNKQEANDNLDNLEKETPQVLEPIKISTVEELAFRTQKEKKECPKVIGEYKGNKMYSPLIKSMAKNRGVSLSDLDEVLGTGLNGRITKDDFFEYLKKRAQNRLEKPSSEKKLPTTTKSNEKRIPVDRVRRIISEHMRESLDTSAHVQSFVEADVTNLVSWRTKIKEEFQKKYNQKITFTPIFVESIVRALRDFPMMNNTLHENHIIVNDNINVGMATALLDGNLLVPVIKNADKLDIVELVREINDLSTRARNNTLQPEETRGGTYTFTNIGGFGNLMGTPIINQPQLGILALGVIQKRPTVVDNKIVIRDKIYLSHSYDHRVIDGALGGMFAKRVADYLEQFDASRTI